MTGMEEAFREFSTEHAELRKIEIQELGKELSH